MTSIVTRTGKGAPLSISELDANFTNLNTDKVEKTRIVGAASGELTVTNGGALNQDIQLGLPNTGVSAGTLNNSATQTTPFTVDAKGRITGTSAPVTLAPQFASIANTPTTLAGYGISDAQGTVTGAATTIVDDDLTASRALASDSSGKVVATAITATELGYLANVTQNLQTQLDGKQGTAAKDQANGYAGLNSSGKLSDAVLPDLAISEYLGEAADETAMLLLTGQKGDWCTRTDVGTIYIITGNPASAGGWMQLSYPGTPVKSVAGKTGVVTLTNTDVGLSAVTNDAQLKIASNLSDLNNTATARTNLGLGNVDNTSDATKNSATVTLTNKTISGSSNTLSNIGNASLTNSSITFGSTAVSLGGTVSALNGVSLGQSTAAAGSFTTLSASSTVTLSAAGQTANGVAYLNGSNQITTGTGLVFDGTNLGIGTSSPFSFAKLTLEQAGADCYLALKKTGGSSSAYISTDGSTLWFGSALGSTGKKISLDLNAPDGAMNISSAGNLGLGRVANTNYRTVIRGIGTTSTTAGLVVENGIGTETFYLNDAGNLGLGVTPSAWASAYKVVQIGETGSVHSVNNGMTLSNNAYYDGANWRRLQAVSAAILGLDSSGNLSFYNGGAGDAGTAIGFIERLRIYSSGTLILRQSSNAANTSVSLNTTVQNALTLDASGNLLVGANSAINGGRFSLDFVGSNGAVLRTDSSAPQYQMQFYTPDGRAGTITTSALTTTYGSTSDYRLKENVQPIQNALSRVALLKPSKYIWKSDQSEGEGFIAHELQEVVPQAVTGEKDAEQMQSVDYGKLTPLLTAAIQELTTRLETLEQRITNET